MRNAYVSRGKPIVSQSSEKRPRWWRGRDGGSCLQSDCRGNDVGIEALTRFLGKLRRFDDVDI